MPPHIMVLNTVLKRLENVHKPAIGALYGIIFDGKILLVGFGFESRFEEENLVLTPFIRTSISRLSMPFFDAPQLIYPAGIDFCGVVTIGGQWSTEEDGTQVFSRQIISLLKEVPVTNNPVYLAKNLDDGRIETFYLRNKSVVRYNFEEMSYSEFREQFVYVRIMSNITCDLKIYPNIGNMDVFNVLSERIATGMVYRISQSDLFLYRYNYFQNIKTTVGSVYNRASKEKDHVTNFEVLRVTAYLPSSISVVDQKNVYAPLVLDYSHTRVKVEFSEEDVEVTLNLPFDGLCIVHRNRTMDDLYSVLTDATERTLYLNEIFVSRYLAHLESFKSMSSNHYFPNELGHPLTLLLGDDDDIERDVRQELHKNLNLTLERPFFRKANRLTFFPSDTTPSALINVHLGIKQLSGSSESIKQAFVYGNYSYYHYMIGGINDEGWGCAYRSLQTICSWFKFQGYFDYEIPTHEQIQMALVEIGDKEPSFVGSTECIGSIEVSYFLEMKWNISSRIQFIASGAEINTLSEIILAHFSHNGTPVMIGGGDLAHIIIGIQFDTESGEVYFLILDPHYSGNNDLSEIQNNGFVGWKDLTFCDPGLFYNLLFPQRNICF